MKNALKSMKCRHNSSASIVDGKLIISLPDAETPVVWQMDLIQAKESAIEVIKGKGEGKGEEVFILAFKTPKGDVTEIALFASRAQAVDSLMAVSNALKNAHGQIRPVKAVAGEAAIASVHLQSGVKPKSGKMKAVLLCVALLFVLYLVLSSMSLRTPGGIGQAGNNSASVASSGSASQDGVPMSADDFLSRR